MERALNQIAWDAQSSEHLVDQSRTPILEALSAARKRKPADFGAPGHGSGRAASSEVRRLVGAAAFAADVLTPKGLDDRTESLQAVQSAHKLAADAWGASVARFSTGGSTQSLHVLLAAVARPGETVLVASNAHKAEYAAAIYAGLNLVPLRVEADASWDIEHGVSRATLEAALSDHPRAKAVLIVSPSYFGVTSDVPKLAQVCHDADVPLIVDAAWGAAFGFNPRLPANPLAQGADAMVVSAHKTLAALGQGSIALVRGDRIDPERFALAFELFQTTSPSVAVLASLDSARQDMARRGEGVWDRVIDLAELARRKLAAIPGVRVFSASDLAGPGAAALSPCVVTLDISQLNVSGFEADDWLVSRHQVVAGLSDFRHLLFNFTQGATARDGQRLVAAIGELAAAARGGGSFQRPVRAPTCADLPLDMALPPVEAFFAPSELTPFASAVGRIAAEIIAPAPPGVPRLAPGQRISAAHVRFLEALHAAHGFLLDPADDPGQAKVRVVVEGGGGG